MAQSISRWNQRMRMLVLVLGAFCGCMLFPLSEVEASGSSVFEVSEAVEEKEGETITLDFASVGVEKTDWGYGQVVGDTFKVFVRDRKVEKSWRFELPARLSDKSNWEITLQVNQFDFDHIGVAVGGIYKFSGGYFNNVVTTAALLIPINGGKCLVRHLRPDNYRALFGNDKPEISFFYDAGQSVQKIALPAKIRFVYDGLEQKYTVMVNDKEVATFCFASFENRLPWNITHIEPVVITPERTPVRMELESKFTVRAW